MNTFKKIDFNKRKNEAMRIKKKYPNSLPIIIYKNSNSDSFITSSYNTFTIFNFVFYFILSYTSLLLHFIYILLSL